MTNFEKKLRQSIEDKISQIKEQKRELGKDFDVNCYGSGYDEGELAGLRFALELYIPF